MADEDDGATPSELLLEACRRNNASLLQTVLSQFHPPPSSSSSSTKKPPTSLASLLNNTLDPLGRTALHICAAGGADDVLDLLLDQEGVEVEPRERHGGDTPLHCAVRYVLENWAGCAGEEEEMKGLMVGVELLLDAGADPRVRNEFGRGVKAEGLLVGGGGSRDQGALRLLREVLAKSEDELNVREHLDREVGMRGREEEEEGDDDGGPTGSQSDSD